MLYTTLLLSFLLSAADAFPTGARGVGQRVSTGTLIASPSGSDFSKESRSRRCSRCPEPETEDVDRREALYAMMGALVGVSSLPAAASATFGQDAKIELPNPVEKMADRVNGQCLVETLGNRECLVYLDPANKLYQGADTGVLLERVEKASEALATIPGLIEDKKWTQVSGVLLGPLGTLVGTMNQLTKLSENESKAADAAKKAKTSLYAISGSVDRKQVDQGLAAHAQATKDLVAFVQSL